MTTIFCNAWYCKYCRPHDKYYGICAKDHIILDEQVDNIYFGCPDYDEGKEKVKGADDETLS